MARRAQAILTAEGWLVTTSPLHVGGIGGDADTDLAFAIDGLGRLIVGGSSLAGALRAWCRGSAEDEPASVSDVWGIVRTVRDSRGGATTEGQASRMVCDDGEVLPSLQAATATAVRFGETSAETIDLADRAQAMDSPDVVVERPDLLERRDGVGIDRVTGTAAAGILYSRTVVPCDAAIRLRLNVEVPPGTGELDREKARLGSLLNALLSGEVSLGAGSTRGLGRVALDRASLQARELPLAKRTGFLDALERGGRDITAELLEASSPASGYPSRRRVMQISVRWEPLGPVMVKAGLDGFSIDSLPLGGRALVPDAKGGQHEVIRLVLPGSGIKGALRNRAELIVRTVLGVAAPAPDNPRTRFLEQLDQLGLVGAIFGWAPGTDDVEPERQRLGRGAISVDDCRSTSEPMTVAEWQALIAPPRTGGKGERVEKSSIDAALRGSLDQKGFREANHVAIDRWTGGAATGALFSVLEPWRVTWEPLRIRIDLDRLGSVDEEPALGLVALLLGELQSGRIFLGHGTNRGMGGMRVTEVTYEGIPGDVSPAAGSAALEAWRAQVLSAWSRWVKDNGGAP